MVIQTNQAIGASKIVNVECKIWMILCTKSFKIKAKPLVIYKISQNKRSSQTKCHFSYLVKVAMEDLMKAISTHFLGFVLEDQPSSTSTVKDSHKEPFVIGVASGTATGKTTICNMIISQLCDQRVALVNQVVVSIYPSLFSSSIL